jgi:hypothetical protein
MVRTLGKRSSGCRDRAWMFLTGHFVGKGIFSYDFGAREEVANLSRRADPGRLVRPVKQVGG